MAIATTEKNYRLAKSLFKEVSEDFYDIENAEHPNEDYLIDKSLDNIKRLNSYLSRINTDDVLDNYSSKVYATIEKNVNFMKEGAYFMEKSLMSMKLYDELIPVLGKYMANVNWESISDSIENATSKFARYLTSRDNHDKYLNIITNIVRGTLKEKAFDNLFTSVYDRIKKPKKKKTKYIHPNPPEMYKDKGKTFKDQLEKRKKAAIDDDNSKEFDKLGESFLALNKYKNTRK